MNVSIRTKLLLLCIALVLVTTVGISVTYYMLTKQDKQRESRQRIQIAFDLILNDLTDRVTTYTTSVNRFLQENITLLWATYTYSLDDSEDGTIRFLFDHFNEVFAELKQFGRVALADRVLLYGANKRLLVVYQRRGDRETGGGYLVSETEGGRYLPMTDLSVQAEITFRNNNLAIHAHNKPFPRTPLPPGVEANYPGEFPDAITVKVFREGQQLGIRLMAPIYRRETKMGLLVGEVFYTQAMVAEYALLSKTEIALFSDNQFSLGTLRGQTYLEPDELAQTLSCTELMENQRSIAITPVTLGKQNYYQGRCVFRDGDETVGAIAVSLSQAIENREIGKIVQAVFTIAGAGILICIGLVSWILVPTFTRPIIRLKNTALRMAQGDLRQAIDTGRTDELGSLARSFAYMRDEIQRKIEELQHLNAELDQRVEERTAELVRQQYILDTFMATVPDRIYFKDRRGRITRANLAHARRMGLPTPDEEVGKTDFDFLPAEEAHRRYQQEQDIIRTGIPLIGAEEQRVRADGRAEWALVTKMPLRNEHGDIIGTFGISRDITNLKQTEETLKHAKEAAEAANRAKTEFLANMNHELRTPLNVILGLAQIMSRNQQIPNDERENLEIIYHSGDHLLSLINHVLDLSQIETGHISLQETSIDLFRLLTELEEMFTLKTAQKRLQLVFERSEDVPPYICTDVTKLRQVLLNVLNNAVKFTESGGVAVRISTLRVPPGNPTSARLPRCKLRFEIEDTGPGIAPDEIETIFEAFGQTPTGRQAQEGTGLGLAISQRFVRLMGGAITVQSEMGRGSIFVITIPVTVAQAADVPVQTPARRVIGLEPGQPCYRILVVDDKLHNRRLLVKLFQPFGFDVREAADGECAVALWQSFAPHLIWMDVRMPVVNGYDATRRIRALEAANGQQHTMIIALTASSSEEEQKAAAAAGCDDILGKPFREADMFDLMQTYLGVRYLYAEPESAERLPAASPRDEELTPAALRTLPPTLYTQLEQAVNVTDPTMVADLIEPIRAQNPRLAEALAEQTKQFRFDILQTLFETEQKA